MKITCGTVEDFLIHYENTLESGGSAVLGHICVSKMARELSEYRSAVVCQVTTLLDTGAGAYLLVCGEECGTDYTDQNQQLNGSDRYAKLEEQIKETAGRFGHKVLPGVIEA